MFSIFVERTLPIVLLDGSRIAPVPVTIPTTVDTPTISL
jgi:hypothetical protein